MTSTTNNNDDESTPLQRKGDDDGGGGGVNPQKDTTSTCFSPTVQTFLIDFYETNHFLIKAILAIILARLYPPLGAQILHPAITGQWMAVMFIFCMAGISIKTSELGIAFTRWKFNIFVLGFNFFGLSFIVYCVTQLLLKYNLLNEGMANGMIVCSVRFFTFYVYVYVTVYVCVCVCVCFFSHLSLFHLSFLFLFTR